MTPALHDACERAVHVVTTEGRVLRAGRASLFILERIGWGRLARLLTLPPFVWLVEIGYRIVANNRSFFGQIMLRGEHPDPAAVGEGPSAP